METTEHLCCTATTPRDGRSFVAAALRERPDDRIEDRAVLLASELVTNAIVHAQSGEVPLSLRLDGRGLRVSVQDSDRQPPHAPPFDPATPGGNGIHIVDALSTRWGFMTVPQGGKVVWFEINWDEPVPSTPTV